MGFQGLWVRRGMLKINSKTLKKYGKKGDDFEESLYEFSVDGIVYIIY